MTSDQIKLQAQVDALQYMLQRGFAMFYIATKKSAQEIKEGHDHMKTVFLTQDFKSDDPALSAFVAGELEDALSEFLSGTEQMTENLRAKRG